MKTLSVVVPFWGVEKYFAECLDSLASQESSDVEFLLVDDCSLDSSLQIAEKYAAIDSRFKIIKLEQNLGQGGARNMGLLQATGDYVWFVDSDDVVQFRTAITDILESLNGDNLDVLQFSTRIWHEFRPKENFRYRPYDVGFNLKSSGEIRKLMVRYPSRTYAVWSKVYKRDFLLENNCFTLTKTIFEDVIASLWMLNATRYKFVDMALYGYRIRQNSSSTSPKDLKAYREVTKNCKGLEDYFHNSVGQADDECEIFTIIKVVDLLFTSQAPVDCFAQASAEEKWEIALECEKFIKSSRLLFENRRTDNIAKAFDAFRDNAALYNLKAIIIRKETGHFSKNIYDAFRFHHEKRFRQVYLVKSALVGNPRALKKVILMSTPLVILVMWRKIKSIFMISRKVQ